MEKGYDADAAGFFRIIMLNNPEIAGLPDSIKSHCRIIAGLPVTKEGCWKYMAILNFPVNK